MPRTLENLTDRHIKTATTPAGRPRKLSDGAGLYLLASPTGARYWRFDYRYSGKRKTLALGTYPEVSLRGARDAARAARDDLRALRDPSQIRRERRAAAIAQAGNTLQPIALEWLERILAKECVPRHVARVRARLENDVFPWLGSRPIAEISPTELLTTVRRIEDRGAAESARRALNSCGQIFRYAVATARAPRDISQDLRGALTVPAPRHFAATLNKARLGQILLVLDGASGSHAVRAALRLGPLVFVRPNELRRALWDQVDLDAAEWRFTLSKSRREPHIVPLSRQAIEVLTELKPATARRSVWVFPNGRSALRPMSEVAVLASMRSLGIAKDEMCGHGWRAVARTFLDEELHFAPHLIEHQMGHVVRDPLGRAYNRTSHLEERRAMMQRWADYLDELRDAARKANERSAPAPAA